MSVYLCVYVCASNISADQDQTGSCGRDTGGDTDSNGDEF